MPPAVSKTAQEVRHTVHSSDPVFQNIRDCHLSVAFSRLKEKGIVLKQKQTQMKNMDLSNLKDFVQTELKNVQAQYKSLSLRKLCLVSCIHMRSQMNRNSACLPCIHRCRSLRDHNGK